MTETNTQVLFNSTPEGLPKAENFKIVETAMPQPGAGQFLLKNHYLSLDPYQRMLMGGGWTYSPNMLKPGDLMVGRVLGEVVQTNNPDFPVGTFVVGRLGWQTHVVSDGTNLDFVVDAKPGVPLSAYLGVCGSTGVTGWVGLKVTGQPKAGETVVVSAAAGSVGIFVGQNGEDDAIDLLLQTWPFAYDDQFIPVVLPIIMKDLSNTLGVITVLLKQLGKCDDIGCILPEMCKKIPDSQRVGSQSRQE